MYGVRIPRPCCRWMLSTSMSTIETRWLMRIALRGVQTDTDRRHNPMELVREALSLCTYCRCIICLLFSLFCSLLCVALHLATSRIGVWSGALSRTSRAEDAAGAGCGTRTAIHGGDVLRRGGSSGHAHPDLQERFAADGSGQSCALG